MKYLLIFLDPVFSPHHKIDHVQIVNEVPNGSMDLSSQTVIKCGSSCKHYRPADNSSLGSLQIPSSTIQSSFQIPNSVVQPKPTTKVQSPFQMTNSECRSKHAFLHAYESSSKSGETLQLDDISAVDSSLGIPSSIVQSSFQTPNSVVQPKPTSSIQSETHIDDKCQASTKGNPKKEPEGQNPLWESVQSEIIIQKSMLYCQVEEYDDVSCASSEGIPQQDLNLVAQTKIGDRFPSKAKLNSPFLQSLSDLSYQSESIQSSGSSTSNDYSLEVDRPLTFSMTPDEPKIHDNHILCLLKNVFGHSRFRNKQEEVVKTTLSGDDCFVIMGTGSGKSLLYQLPALYERPKVTFVVSPLISLIEEQVQEMNKVAPQSAIALTKNAPLHCWELIQDPNSLICIVFVTPEKNFNSRRFESTLRQLSKCQRLGRFVVDECHCCSEWGHDFRPDYARLGILRSNFPHIPILALTATASPRTKENICSILKMKVRCSTIQTSVDRPNLRYSIQWKSSATQVLADISNFIRTQYPCESGIVYTFSRQDAEDVARGLCANNIQASPYHSGMSEVAKCTVYEEWTNDTIQVIVATIAFGLGINKKNV